MTAWYKSQREHFQRHFSMKVRSKWIWLRWGVEKQVRLEYLDARHFNTAQDILDRFHTKSCTLRLYDSGRELEPTELVLPLREYTVKRHPNGT